jgi:hypothetical protein
MTQIIGDFTVLRKPNNVLIGGQICDMQEDQNIQQNIYFTGIPLIVEMLTAKKDGKTEFRAGVYEYEIQDVNHPDLIKKKMKQLMLQHTETIHLVTAKSFNGITRHCPNCDIQDNELLQFVKAHIQRKTNSKKYLVINGVLYCNNCDYYYMNKTVFRGLPNKIRKDLGIQLAEIKIDKYGRIIKDDWQGAADSILSRNGYTADGSLRASERTDVLRHIIDNNIGSYFDIQSHLTWLLNTRSLRNPNAAAIWKSDLNWLQTTYGKGQNVKGKF